MNSGENSAITINGPGILYIFNHTKFHIELKLNERHGTELDVLALQNAFAKYDVTNILFNDLSIDQINQKFTDISNEDYSKNSCIIVAILSHGNQNNMMAAHDDYYNFYEMLAKISTNITLKSKPKIFLLQACRGNINLFSLRGYMLSDDTTDPVQPTNQNYYCDELYILQSTTETIKAFRLADHGSFFIQAFCRCLTKFGNHKPIRDIFDDVMDEVQSETDSCQLPQISINTRNSYIFGKYCLNDASTSTDQKEPKIDGQQPKKKSYHRYARLVARNKQILAKRREANKLANN